MPLTEEETNFLRLYMLVTKVATPATRYFFDQKFLPPTLGNTILNNKGLLNGLKSKRIINSGQWDLLFPPAGVVSCSTKYDVTLLICLLRNIRPSGPGSSVIPPPATGFDQLPPNTDLCEGADLARIKHFRNFVAHHKDSKIGNADFNLAWTNLSGAISRLGATNYDQECSDLRVAALDQEAYKEVLRIQSELTVLQQDVDVLVHSQEQSEKLTDDNSLKLTEHAQRLDNHLGKLNDHSEKFRDQSLILEGHSGRLDDHSAKLEEYSVNLDNYTKQLQSQSETQRDLSKTIEKHANDYERHSTKFEEYSDKHAKLLDTHFGKLNEHSQNLNEQSLILEDHSERLDDHSERLKDHLKSFEKHAIDFQYHSKKFKENSDRLDIHSRQLVDHSRQQDAFSERLEYQTEQLLKNENETKIAQEHVKRFAEQEKKVKDKRKIHIDGWKKDEQYFTDTRATQFVTESIKNHDVVVVTGSSGTGKSSIIHHIALELETKEGYEIIPSVTCPSDIIQHRDMNKNQVFVIDDCCGKSFINDQGLQNWREQEDAIKILIQEINSKDVSKSGNMKILVSCRLNIYKDTKFKSLKMFTETSCNLESEKHCLLLEEREAMIKKYTKLSRSDLIVLKEMFETYPYFPLICKMSKDKRLKEVIGLFSSPIKCIKDDIEIMIESRNYEFCVLVLCVLFDEGFDEAFIEETPDIICAKLEAILANFDIKLHIERHRNELIDTFKRLEGTYVKETKSGYIISHDKLFDIILVSCGSKLIRLFIDFLPAEYIAERFRFSSVFPETTLKQDLDKALYLYISEKYEKFYYERIYQDLKKKDYTSFFYNQQLNEKKYKDRLINYVKKNNSVWEELFCELDVNYDYDELDVKHADDDDVENDDDDDDDDEVSDDETSEGAYYNGNYFFDYDDYELPYEKPIYSTPLIEASATGFTEMVEFLISAKGIVNAEDSDGYTPLYYSCSFGHLDVVQLLISSGASDRKLLYKYEYLLYDMCESGHTDILKILLEKYVDVSCFKGREGRTPLRVACENGHTDIVNMLLARNVDPSEFDIISACKRGHIDIFSLLLETNTELIKCGDILLYVACEEGYAGIVQILLHNKVDPSGNSGSSFIPLHGACKGGHIDIVKLLFKHNADPSILDQCDKTSLYVACESGHASIVELLLNTNTYLKDTGECPLVAACKNNYIDVVKLLLERNANPSQQRPDGSTPLEVACQGGHSKIVKLLLEKNANPLQNCHGGTPLHIACENGDTEIVKMLIDKTSEQTCDEDGRTPLHFACEGGHLDIVTLLLDKNGNPLQCDQYGHTPFYDACAFGHLDVVELLLSKNVDPSQYGKNERNPLEVAYRQRNFSIFRLLLEKNAYQKQTDSGGRTPLHWASEDGNADIVQLLLEQSFDPSACDKNGRNPLHGACKHGHIDVIKLLLENNVNPSQCDKDGRNPLHVACECGYMNIVSLLLEQNVDPSQCDKDGRNSLHVACECGYNNIVSLLLEQNVDQSQHDKDGSNSLHCACEHGDVDIVTLLLDNNFDPSRSDDLGRTPLHRACEGTYFVHPKNKYSLQMSQTDMIHSLLYHNYHQYQECDENLSRLLDRNRKVQREKSRHERSYYKVVELLLNKKVDPAKCDNRGYTPLFIASVQGKIDIVQLLLSKNVDPSQCDTEGYTPLHVACMNGHIDVVKLLLVKNADLSIKTKDGHLPFDVAENYEIRQILKHHRP